MGVRGLIYRIVIGRHYREPHTNVSIYTLTPFPSSTFDGRGVCGMWRRGRSSAYLLLLRRAGPHLSSRNGTGTSKKDAAPSTVAAMRGFNAVNILFPNSWRARSKISGIYDASRRYAGTHGKRGAEQTPNDGACRQRRSRDWQIGVDGVIQEGELWSRMQVRCAAL